MKTINHKNFSFKHKNKTAKMCVFYGFIKLLIILKCKYLNDLNESVYNDLKLLYSYVMRVNKSIKSRDQLMQIISTYYLGS